MTTQTDIHTTSGTALAGERRRTVTVHPVVWGAVDAGMSHTTLAVRLKR